MSSGPPTDSPPTPPVRKDIAVGDRVFAAPNDEQPGTIRFIGEVEFQTGVWVGVELDEPLGKNDGEVQGKRYFNCAAKYGLFMRQEKTIVAAVPPKPRKSKIPPPPIDGGTPSPKAGRARASLLGMQQADEEFVRVKMELAQAVEDHDIVTIGKLMPAAQNLGVPMKELESAQKILHYEVRNALLMEMEDVRQAVDGLSETVDAAVARATEVAQSVEKKMTAEEKAGSTSTAPAATGAKTASGSPVKADDVAKQLAERMWTILEPRIDEMVRGAVERSMKSMRVEGGFPAATEDTTATAAVISEAFENTDQNMDGVLDAKEAAAAGISKQKFAEIDRDGDGVVNAAEFAEAAQDSMERERAAMKMQARARGNKDRARVQQMRGPSQEDRAAMKLQARARGQQSRIQTKAVAEQKRKAVMKLQNAARNWKLEKSGGGGGNKFAIVALLAKKQNRKFGAAFLDKADGNALDCGKFAVALREVHPGTTIGQCQALWKGFVNGSGEEQMNLQFFIGVCEAVALGDSAAAEIADVRVDTYQALGAEGGDGAATKLQSTFRGKQDRQRVQEMKNPTSPTSNAESKPVLSNAELALEAPSLDF